MSRIAEAQQAGIVLARGENVKYWMVLVFWFLSSPAYADCVDPYSCICTNYMDFAGVYAGVVTETNEDDFTAKVRIDTIHLREGRSRTGGPELDELVEVPKTLEVGTKVLLEFEDDGTADVHFPVFADADGQVSCNYSLDDFQMSVEDALQAKLGDDCRGSLDMAGLQIPPCSDGPFGCTALNGSPQDWSVLSLVFLSGFCLRRRRLLRS